MELFSDGTGAVQWIILLSKGIAFFEKISAVLIYPYLGAAPDLSIFFSFQTWQLLNNNIYEFHAYTVKLILKLFPILSNICNTSRCMSAIGAIMFVSPSFNVHKSSLSSDYRKQKKRKKSLITHKLLLLTVFFFFFIH